MGKTRQKKAIFPEKIKELKLIDWSVSFRAILTDSASVSKYFK